MRATYSGTTIYTPHSIRATAATLLLGADVDIRKVQELLGHRHVTTTQIYDKRLIAVSESASHDVPIRRMRRGADREIANQIETARTTS